MTAPLLTPVQKLATAREIVFGMESSLNTAVDLAEVLYALPDKASNRGLTEDECRGLARVAIAQMNALADVKETWQALFDAIIRPPQDQAAADA